MSPARIIDIRGILHHVEWRFSERRSLSGGGLPSPSPEVPGRRSPSLPAPPRQMDQGRRSRARSLSSPENSARSAGGKPRALVVRLGGDTADDVNAKTTMLVVGAEGFEGSGRAAIQASNKLKRAEELKAGGAPDSDRPRGRVLPAGWRADGADAAAAVSLDPRSAGALPAASRGSLALSGEVRRDPAGRPHQRRHLFRVRGSGGHQAGQRRACGQRIVPRGRPEPDGLPARSAGVRLPSRRGARQDPDASTSAWTGRRRGRRPATVDGERDTRAGRGILSRGIRARRRGRVEAGAGRRRLSQSARMRSVPRAGARSTWPTFTTAATSSSKRRRSTSAPSVSSPISSRRTSISATSTTTSAGSPRRSHAIARRCGSIPFYADAHFYLAVTFEKMGQSQEARPHWKAYQTARAARRVGGVGEGVF